MLEIACFDITSAEIALQSVADRIEFCSDIAAGGLTPNIDEFCYLKSKYSKPIHVMIRPKGGSFLYNDLEFEQMKYELVEFRNSGADGFVFGILEAFNEIDKTKNSTLLNLADGRPCVFHRAIDRTTNLNASIETLISLGFSGVLTSGHKKTAAEGVNNLRRATDAYAKEIEIIIGGGVRSSNVDWIKKVTRAKWYHSSAILPYESYANEDEIKMLKNKIGKD